MQRFCIPRRVAVLAFLGAACAAAGSPPPVDWIIAGPGFAAPAQVDVLGRPRPLREGGRRFVRFGGKADGYIAAVNPLAGWSRFTVEALFRPDPFGPAEQRFFHIEDYAGDDHMTMETRIEADGSWALDTYLRSRADHRTLLDRLRHHPSGRWHWAALRYDGRIMSSWVDGRLELSGPVVFPPMGPGHMSVGVRLNRVYWYQGDIARLRFFPKALPPAQLDQVP